MNKVLQFYDYEKCFQHYAERIAHMRQAKVKDELLFSKQVFLLALLKEMDGHQYNQRYFMIGSSSIEHLYDVLMKEYNVETPMGINEPYWHLAKDGFWHLLFNVEYKGKSTPSVEWMRDKVFYAGFDDDLATLLYNEEYRNKMRDFITDLIDSQKKK